MMGFESNGGLSMKAVILAGGVGARISEEPLSRPKPMEEIGGRPVLWHILKMYSHHQITDFVICLGSKGYMVKEFFANYFLHTADVTFDLVENRMEVHQSAAEPWKVTLVDTGEDTGTGGRLRRIQKHLVDEASFCMTYGDTVSDLDIGESIIFHNREGKLATLTAVQSQPRFGILGMEGADVHSVHDSPSDQVGWVNGGFYVLSPKILDLIPDDPTVRWEQRPLEKVSEMNELNAYRHRGFWQPLDTLRDRRLLEHLWDTGTAPWKTW